MAGSSTRACVLRGPWRGVAGVAGPSMRVQLSPATRARCVPGPALMKDTGAQAARSMGVEAHLASGDASPSHVVVEAQLTDDMMYLQTPLPGQPGLHTVGVGLHSSVGDLVGAVVAIDDSIDDVTVLSLEGTPVARSAPVWQLAKRRWSLRMDDVSIHVRPPANGLGVWVPQPMLDDAYARVVEGLRAIPERTTTFNNFLSLCRKALADAAPSHGAEAAIFDNKELLELCGRWKTSLHQQGVILHFDASHDSELRETLFLQPHTMKMDLIDGLDVDGDTLRRELELARSDLALLRAELSDALSVQAEIDSRASKYVSRVTALVGLGMAGQFAGLAALVYEVSWDVMEPAIYFLGLGYSVVFYGFFLKFKMDPEYDNMFGTLLRWRKQKLYAREDFDEAELEILRDSVRRKIGDINLLWHRLAGDSALELQDEKVDGPEESADGGEAAADGADEATKTQS